MPKEYAEFVKALEAYITQKQNETPGRDSREHTESLLTLATVEFEIAVKRVVKADSEDAPNA